MKELLFLAIESWGNRSVG